ncbi:hypothetical protein F5B22DRAFT_593999 [Xylaria bambusicola]|uniref:uncharacterized protein n=1 Tax=Xylaria bambusicola TaxID=326684 RepID=UPI002008059F|nr:uncharacterized protein F5B22DRAFT_593999 [Xylaria bambusicola]KAI0521768.1 hypothetical protein F5B22DRAFT_593999 [Xylaria bambusicola]
MSDLRYIMDTTDDEDRGNDKYSPRPGASDLARSSNPSSTTKQSEDKLPSSTTDTTTSQPRRRGLLSRSSRSTTTVSPTTTTVKTDKASSSRPSLTERESAGSTESMDPASYGSYNQSSSSSTMPPSGRSSIASRPMSSAPGEREIPVKLTPITGRVSRAKKGVPVHTCDICKPPKTFTRAEHLRRHQLSHKPAAFQCPWHGCDKVFHRQDLLTRHTQRHEQDDRSGTDMASHGSRGPSHTPVDSNPSINSFPQAPMLPGTSVAIADDMSANTPYPGSASPYPTSHRGSVSGPMSPSSRSTRSHSTGFSHSQGDYILSSAAHAPFGIPPSSMDGSLFHTNSYGLEFQPRKSPSYTSYMGLEGLPSLTIPDSSFPGHLSQESNWPSSASDSPYSTPDRMRHYDSPSADIPNSDMYYVPHQYPSPQPPIYHPVSDYTTPYDDAYFDYPSHQFPVRSQTPSTVTISAQPVENLVTLGHSVPDASAILGRQKRAAEVLSPYADAALFASVFPSTAALSAIPHYLEVYWKGFDTFFPIVHRRSLETCTDPVLRCAMAAVGSQFLQSKEDRLNSHILHGFASQEARRRPQWSVQVMQAILLCEFYGRFRGAKATSRASEPFQSLYSRVAASETSFDHDNSASTSPQHWDEWINAESRRRLLAASFILDIHTSMYHEHSVFHPFATATPPIPLMKHTQHLWTAQDPAAWEELLSSEPSQLGSITVADEEITANHVSTALPMDLAVYLASEALRLPRRSLPSTVDFSTSRLDLDSTLRIRSLFPNSPVANTYLALHYTPLNDLLAATGDSWLFSKKILDQEVFQRRKLIVRHWSGSAHAGAASTFAAKALLGFLDRSSQNQSPSPMEQSRQISELSDYWALYVCTLICWSINRTKGRDASAYHSNSTSGKSESDARRWLKTVASLDPETAIDNVRARREALGVVAMVRRRLEHESSGGKSKLLVDAIRVLKSLEDDPNRARF